MGAFLEKPKTEKRSEHGCGNGLTYGVSSMQGWRIEMEDAHCAIVGLPYGLRNWSFFAVFDGHAGDGVSAYCAENLLNSIMQTEDFRNCANCNGQVTAEEVELVKRGIWEGFLRLDEKMKKIPEILSGEDKSGSTAVCALISATHFYFANCGDSRAVLSRDSRSFFSTQDHKPINPTEKERIMKAGGSVMIQRVNGSLAVSRALGDYEYKQVEGKGPCEQLVSPEPEVTVQERDNELDEFLVLACDGVWDVMSNDELCEYIRHMLRITSDLEYICSSVIDACFYKGSKDNMSIVIVALPGAPSISEAAVQQDEELNRTLEQRVTEIIDERDPAELNDVMHILAVEDISGLPPGGGLWSKRSFLEDLWVRLKQNEPHEAKRPLHQRKAAHSKSAKKIKLAISRADLLKSQTLSEEPPPSEEPEKKKLKLKDEADEEHEEEEEEEQKGEPSSKDDWTSFGEFIAREGRSLTTEASKKRMKRDVLRLVADISEEDGSITTVTAIKE